MSKVVFPRLSRNVNRAARAAVWVAAIAAAPAVHAIDYTYTAPNTTNAAPGDNWSAGANWSATPVSDAANGLIFSAPTTNGINRQSNNDIGTFVLNTLTFAATTGPSGNSANATLTLNGGALNFTSNGATTPVMTLSANANTTGTPAPTYSFVVNNNLILTNNTTFTGAGTATFSFFGTVSGGGSLTKSGASGIGLAGANTYTGGTTLSAGTIRVANSSVGTVGSITSGPLGTGTLTMTGGILAASGTTARSLLNPIAINGNITFGDAVNTGTLTLLGPGTLSATRQISVGTGATAVFSGDIGQTAAGFGLTKAGAGTLALGGTNTFTGAFTANAGVLRFDAASAVAGTGRNITVAAGGAVGAGGSYTNAALMGRIVTTSAGTLAISANSSESFDFAAEGLNSLYLGAAVGTTPTYTGTLTPAGTSYRLGGGGGVLTLSGTNAVTGANNLVVDPGSAGVVNLAAANDYTGATTVGVNGTLRLSNNNAIAGTSGVTVTGAGGIVQLPGGVTISGKTITINGTSGQGSLQTNGAAGQTATWDGPVVLGSDGARLGTSAGTAGTLVVSGAISSPGGSFAPAIRTDNAGGVVRFAAANTYTGVNTQIVVGTLQLGAEGALPSTTVVTLGNNSAQGSTALNLNGFSTEIAGLATVSGVNINATVSNTATAAVLTINNSTARSFGTSTRGLISGNIALVKKGVGTQTLMGASPFTYNGGTTVEAGTLAGASDGVLGTGNVTVFSGATLQLSGGTTNNYISNTADLILASGSPTVALNFTGTDTIGMLSVDGGVTWLPEGVYGSSTSSAPLGNQLPMFTGTGTVTVTATIIPEPATAAVGALTALGLLARRRSRRRA